MIQFTVETEIARPPADVFAYITDPSKLSTWQTGTISAVAEQDGPLGLGTRLREVHRAPGGKQLTSLLEVSEYEPGTVFALRMLEGALPIHARITLAPSGLGTRLRFDSHGHPSGAGRLAQPVLQHTLKRQFASHCATLKQVLEDPTSPDDKESDMTSAHDRPQSHATQRGDVFVNEVTGEQAVVLLGNGETAGERLVAHLTIAPGGAVNGAHQHPSIEERFRVLSGEVGFRVGDSQHVAPVGEEVLVPPGVVHDWWNAGPTAAEVIVDIRPGARFEQMIKTSFGLANAGRTNAKGMPGLLQLAVIATEFRDTIVFTSPPPALQRMLFAVLAPLGRLRGLRAIYPEFDAPHRHEEPPLDLLELLKTPAAQPDTDTAAH